jgi:hypothetical protein
MDKQTKITNLAALLVAEFLIISSVIRHNMRTGGEGMDIQTWVSVAIGIIIGISIPVITSVVNRSGKKILDRLGDGEDGLIMKALGADKDRLNMQIGTQYDDGKSLTVQHKEIRGGVEKLNLRADAADKRNEKLSGDIKDLSKALDVIGAFKDRIERDHDELVTLRAENSYLKERLDFLGIEKESAAKFVQAPRENTSDINQTYLKHHDDEMER